MRGSQISPASRNCRSVVSFGSCHSKVRPDSQLRPFLHRSHRLAHFARRRTAAISDDVSVIAAPCAPCADRRVELHAHADRRWADPDRCRPLAALFGKKASNTAPCRLDRRRLFQASNTTALLAASRAPEREFSHRDRSDYVQTMQK